MKKLKNLLFILFIFLIIMSNLISYAGLIVTPETLNDTLLNYSNGNKKANTIINNKTPVRLNFSGNNTLNVSVTDSTITINDYIFEYLVTDDSVKFAYTADLNPDSEFSLDTQNLYMALLFVATCDLCEIKSNTSLYKYYTEYYSIRNYTGTIPADLKKANAMDYMKFLSSTREFDSINNSIYKMYNQILIDNNKQFKYKTTLDINFENIQELKKLEASTPLSSEELEDKTTVSTEDIVNNENTNSKKFEFYDILLLCGIILLIGTIIFFSITEIKKRK